MSSLSIFSPFRCVIIAQSRGIPITLGEINLMILMRRIGNILGGYCLMRGRRSVCISSIRIGRWGRRWNYKVIGPVRGIIIVLLWEGWLSKRHVQSTSPKKTCSPHKASNPYTHTTNRKHPTYAVGSQCLWTPNAPAPINKTTNNPTKPLAFRGSRLPF